MRKLWREYKFVIIVFIVWKLSLFAIEHLAPLLIPVYSATYMGKSPWANTDGLNYIRIAQSGYGQLNEAFFPLYPLLIRFVHSVVPLSYEAIGIGISALCFFVGLILLYGMVKRESVSLAKWTVALIISFPTAFFFTSVYTEGLFFLLAVSALFFAKKKQWFLAGISVGLASGTRIIGISTAILVIYEWWKVQKKTVRFIDIVSFFCMPLGLALYMYFLYQTTGDALRFFHIQAEYVINRSGQNLILLPQVMWRYMKIFVTAVGQPTMVAYAVSIMEFFLTSCSFVLLYVGWRKKENAGYLLYSLVALLVPTLTGTFASMPRYILTIFPLFILLAKTRSSMVKAVCVCIFSALQIVAAMIYLRGWFIA